MSSNPQKKTVIIAYKCETSNLFIDKLITIFNEVKYVVLLSLRSSVTHFKLISYCYLTAIHTIYLATCNPLLWMIKILM